MRREEREERRREGQKREKWNKRIREIIEWEERICKMRR